MILAAMARAEKIESRDLVERSLGKGCDEAEISEEKRLFTEWGPGIR